MKYRHMVGSVAEPAVSCHHIPTVSFAQAIKIPKCFADYPAQPYHTPFIEMSPELQASLDYESKLDRGPEPRQVDDGWREAGKEVPAGTRSLQNDQGNSE